MLVISGLINKHIDCINRFIDFNIESNIVVKPGVHAESNKHFDKKLISKWQEIFFNTSRLSTSKH